MKRTPNSQRILFFLSSLAWIGDFCNSMLDILFIFYAVQLGFEPGPIGLISSIYGIIYLITPALFGKLIDKLPHRQSLLIATSGQAGISIIYIFLINMTPAPSKILFWILAGQAFRATAYAFYWPTIEVLYSETAHGDERKHERYISFFCIAWSLGAALGTSFAGIFGEWILISGFIITSIIYLIGFGIVYWGLSSRKSVIIEKSNSIQQNDKKRISNSTIEIKKPIYFNPTHQNLSKTSITTDSSRMIWQTLIGTLVFAIISKGILAYVPNYAVIPEGLGLSKLISGQIAFAFGIGRFLGFIMGQFITNSFRKLSQNMGFVSIFMISVAFSRNSWLLIIELFIIGYVTGRIYYIALELLMKYVTHGKGSKAGLFESIVGLGSGISPFIAGWLAEWNLIAPFFFFSLVAGMGFVYLVFQRNSQRFDKSL
ncbi:MAG: MFS transporter [Candidatus Lokiarchaeota archaeon]|nr:MFS transporter [Candidatus Harpocratesius repetitus]